MWNGLLYIILHIVRVLKFCFQAGSGGETFPNQNPLHISSPFCSVIHIIEVKSVKIRLYTQITGFGSQSKFDCQLDKYIEKSENLMDGKPSREAT